MADYKTIKGLVAAIKCGQAVPGLRLVSADLDMLLLLHPEVFYSDEPHVVDTDDGTVHKASEVSWPLEVAQHQPYHVQVALGWVCGRGIKGKDLHQEVAAQVLGVPLEEVTEDQRRQSKAAGFGFCHGVTPDVLSKALKKKA